MKKLLMLCLLTSPIMATPINIPSKKQTKVDPLSKIIVTSERAVGKTDATNKKIFMFSYLSNVKTVFADNSQITADQLDISFDKDGIATQGVVSSLTKEIKQDKASQFKKVLFSKNVCIKRQAQIIHADSVELDPSKRCCILQGNVCVSQRKQKSTDVPIDMKSEKAILSLDSGSVTFLGSSIKPVNTVINLGTMDILKKKPKKVRAKA